MISRTLLLVLVTFPTSIFASEWVSVSGGRTVAPAAPVESAIVHDGASQAQIISTPSSSSSTLLAEMSMQMEQMQQEVAELRGRVEEQDQIIRRLTDDQQQRYLDLDRRIALLMSESQSAAKSSAPVQGVVASEVTKTASEAYQDAMKLVREKKFSDAQIAFAEFVQRYPNDALLGNALYWHGEVFLVLGESDKALQKFKQVLELKPIHDKAADSTYKVGVTLHKQGNNAEAKVWLQRVVERFSGKADSTVRLAKAYLEKI